MRTSGWNIILLEMKLPQKTSAPPMMPITGQAPVVWDKLSEKVTATRCQAKSEAPGREPHSDARMRKTGQKLRKGQFRVSRKIYVREKMWETRKERKCTAIVEAQATHLYLPTKWHRSSCRTAPRKGQRWKGCVAAARCCNLSGGACIEKVNSCC